MKRKKILVGMMIFALSMPVLAGCQKAAETVSMATETAEETEKQDVGKSTKAEREQEQLADAAETAESETEEEPETESEAEAVQKQPLAETTAEAETAAPAPESEAAAAPETAPVAESSPETMAASEPTEPVPSEPTAPPPSEPETAPPVETVAPETAPPETEAKTCYDYPFDVEAIRAELIGVGEAAGLTHTEGRTPANSSWAMPVTASESFQGEALKRSLYDYVSSMPELIVAYGGSPITEFTIYVEDIGGGSYTFYFLD